MRGVYKQLEAGLMKSNRSNKIIFDTQETSFPNAENLVSVTEGLVQLMYNRIKYNRLYFVYLIMPNIYISFK